MVRYCQNSVTTENSVAANAALSAAIFGSAAALCPVVGGTYGGGNNNLTMIDLSLIIASQLLSLLSLIITHFVRNNYQKIFASARRTSPLQRFMANTENFFQPIGGTA